MECKNKVCKTCLTFINNKPICPECMLNFVREKVSFIMFKGDGIKFKEIKKGKMKK